MSASVLDRSADPGTPGLKRWAVNAFSGLLDLVTLLVVVQGLLAGVFLQHDGKRDSYESWISAHGMVADTTIVLTLVATVVGFVGLRARRDLWVGSGVLAVLLVVEAYLGGRINEAHEEGLTIVHVPLAMALLGLAVWLVVRAIALRRSH